MGLFRFLNKQVECDRCGSVFDKKLIGKYDTTHQGKIKGGVVKNLCKKCIIEALLEQIKEYIEKAIIIMPNKKYNAYAFYQFNNLKDSDELINGMKSMLPHENSICTCCSEPAQFTYCSLDIFQNEDPYSWEIDLDNKTKCKLLCKECLINALKQNIDEEDITFSGVYPMIDGSGFLTPWEI